MRRLFRIVRFSYYVELTNYINEKDIDPKNIQQIYTDSEYHYHYLAYWRVY